MRKLWVIAAREYKAAVRTKAFLISLVLVPVLWAASIGIQVLVHKAEDRGTKKFAVVDRTADKQVTSALDAAVKMRNEKWVYDEGTGEQNKPKYELIHIPASPPDQDAILAQRYELSEQCQHGEYEGFLDIGPDVYAPDDSTSRKDHDERREVRFQSAKPGAGGFEQFAAAAVNAGVQQHRFAEHKVSLGLVKEMQQRVEVKSKGLTERDTVTGRFHDATEETRVGSFVLPAVLIVLMYFMILVGATPAMHGVIEEKQQRISEVVLGSVSPFQLMLGKLLGVVGVALTVAAAYAIVGGAIARRYGIAEILTPTLLAYFFLFLVLAVLTYASLFIAVGAAASDIKETQSLLMPIMLMAAMPMFLLGVVIQNPNGSIAVAGSFFPFTAPMFMTARVAMPPGIGWWQPVLSVAIVLATVLACVWAAGRIFRVGLLLQGKGVKFADLARWVVRG
jgi:ABC-type Na+ efflux pump permease subunit